MRTKLENLPAAMQAEAAALLPGLAPSLDERVVAARKVAARTNAKNDGRDFQKEMEATCAAYQARGIATLRKVDPPVRVFWKQEPNGTRRQVVVFLQNPWLDYMGTWTARGGRTLLVEAKSTATHRLPFKKEHGSLALTQVNAIRTWQLSRAAVCVVWQWAGNCCLFTAEMIRAADAEGVKSLVFEAGLPVPRGDAGTWDFLPVLEAATAPRRVELTYLGATIYFAVGARVWFCEGMDGGPFETVEKAMEAVDRQRGQNCSTGTDENKY